MLKKYIFFLIVLIALSSNASADNIYINSDTIYNSNITLEQNSHIIGDGIHNLTLSNTSQVIFNNNTGLKNVNIILDSSHRGNIWGGTNCENIDFTNVSYNGNDASIGYVTGNNRSWSKFSYCKNISVTNSTFYNSSSTPIQGDNCSNVTITSNNFYNLIGAALYGGFSDNTNAAAYFGFSDGVNFSNNTASYIDDNVLAIIGDKNVSMCNNSITHARHLAIIQYDEGTATPTKNILIKDNSITGVETGIMIGYPPTGAYCSDTIIENNTIRFGNELWSNIAGLEIKNTPYNVSIHDNRFDSCGIVTNGFTANISNNYFTTIQFNNSSFYTPKGLTLSVPVQIGYANENLQNFTPDISALDHSVYISAIDQTAKRGRDYTFVNSLLTIPAEQTSKNITIDIINMGAADTGETYLGMQLTNPTNNSKLGQIAGTVIHALTGSSDGRILTVNSGRGSGYYQEGEIVSISSDDLPIGMSFNKWTGDTQYVTDIHSSSTTVTIPSSDVSITANYIASWFDKNYNNRILAKVKHTVSPNSDQQNFPLLTSISDQNLKTVSNGGKVSNGNDIVLVLPSKVKLDTESELYNGKDGNVIKWVRIPTLSTTTDTYFYIYFNNTKITTSQDNVSGVWDSHYKYVSHFNDAGSDSSTNENNNLNSASNLTFTTGQIYAAQTFNGIDAYLNIGNNFDISPGFTIETIVKIQKSPLSDTAIIYKEGYPPWTYWRISLKPSGQTQFLLYDGTNNPGVSTVSINDSNYHFLTYTRGTKKLYASVDTVQNSVTDNTGTFTTGNNLNIGRSYGGAGNVYSNMTLDELRISDIARSTDWTTTEYNNIFYNSMFTSYGQTESVPTSNFTASPTSGVVPLTVKFHDQNINATSWAWDFDNDGKIDSTQKNPSKIFSKPGLYSVNLTVRTTTGNYSTLEPGFITVSSPSFTDPVGWAAYIISYLNSFTR